MSPLPKKPLLLLAGAALALSTAPFATEPARSSGAPIAAVAPGTPGGPLSLGDCLGLALEKNPAGKSAQQAAVGAKESTGVARAPYYPSVGFSAMASRWQRRIFLPAGIGFPGQPIPEIVGPTDDYVFSLAANYTLFDSGERKAQLGAAEARLRASEASLAGAREDIALQVHTAFYSLEAALESRSVAKENLERARDLVRVAKERKAVGAVPLADVLRAEVQEADVRLSLVRAESAVRVARGRLATELGLPAETAIEIGASAADIAPPDEAGLPALLDSAAKNRSQVIAAREGVEAARRGLDQARSAWGPKVAAMASYGKEDASWWPEDTNWTLGVSVSLPVFTGFARGHGEARARADLARAEADLDQVALAARQQAWSAFSSVTEAFEVLQATEAYVKSALESHRLAKERYAVGAGTVTDVLDSEAPLAAAEASSVNAQWGYRAALAQFRWSVGDLLATSPP